MSLQDVLESKPIQVRTLDDRTLNLSIDEMITPQLVHKVEGEGMPRKEDRSQKGDLYVKFNIVFPQDLKVNHLNEIIEVLSQ